LKRKIINFKKGGKLEYKIWDLRKLEIEKPNRIGRDLNRRNKIPKWWWFLLVVLPQGVKTKPSKREKERKKEREESNSECEFGFVCTKIAICTPHF
jgi:hypothetical protein